MTDHDAPQSPVGTFQDTRQDIQQDNKPRGTALALVSGPGGSDRTTAPRPARPFAVIRHDPSFVAQLIATADHAPQTRLLRRASPQDAQSSYRAVAASVLRRPPGRPQPTSRVA